ncbi:hypothetical protein SK128_001537 [Halocaridina rubra]|uniref:Uncharacterized protein n=1 Tax=Halocaridina rubra TaxID=373956 RepID=A0AAN8X608_HALRR
MVKVLPRLRGTSKTSKEWRNWRPKASSDYFRERCPEIAKACVCLSSNAKKIASGSEGAQSNEKPEPVTPLPHPHISKVPHTRSCPMHFDTSFTRTEKNQLGENVSTRYYLLLDPTKNMVNWRFYETCGRRQQENHRVQKKEKPPPPVPVAVTSFKQHPKIAKYL